MYWINNRLVITEDLNQSNIPKVNGIYDLVSKVENYNNTKMIKMINFYNEDIEIINK